MRKLTLILVSVFTLGSQTIYGQNNIIVNPKSSTITAKKIINTDLLIPIELDFVNTTPSLLTPTIIMQIDNTTPPIISQFNSTDVGKIKIINNNQTISINANETKGASNIFYLFVDESVLIKNDKTIYIQIKNRANQLGTIKIIIQPDDKTLPLDEYMKDKLDYVTKVESSNNVLTIGGYKEISANDGTKEDLFLKRNIELKRGELFAINEWSWIADAFHWKPLPISLTTIPFKVRSKITSKGKEFSSSATSGISNIGFNLDLVKYQMDRYFATGKKSTHKLSLGLWAAPSVEELDSIYTHGALGKAAGKMEKSKQLFISTGITISYSYNDISFVFVPFGWDFGTSTIGKQWIYNKQRWFGFGIAISPKIFSTILNK